MKKRQKKGFVFSRHWQTSETGLKNRSTLLFWSYARFAAIENNDHSREGAGYGGDLGGFKQSTIGFYAPRLASADS
jgi:hypothetical protein